MSTWMVTSRNSPIFRIGMRSMSRLTACDLRAGDDVRPACRSSASGERVGQRRLGHDAAARSMPRWTIVCAICGRMPLMMHSAPIRRAAVTVFSRCCATSVSTVGTPVMSMIAMLEPVSTMLLQQRLHHDLRPGAVERADHRQRQDAVPQLDDRRGELEHLLLLARDHLLAAALEGRHRELRHAGRPADGADQTALIRRSGSFARRCCRRANSGFFSDWTDWLVSPALDPFSPRPAPATAPRARCGHAPTVPRSRSRPRCRRRGCRRATRRATRAPPSATPRRARRPRSGPRWSSSASQVLREPRRDGPSGSCDRRVVLCHGSKGRSQETCLGASARDMLPAGRLRAKPVQRIEPPGRRRAA